MTAGVGRDLSHVLSCVFFFFVDLPFDRVLIQALS
jgi:hypothetical protein